MQNHPTISNIACLVAACDNLSIPYTFYDTNHNLVGIRIKDKEYFFANHSTPFNSESLSSICQDKEFSYQILKEVLTMPRTIGFLDPNCNTNYKSLVKEPTHEEILDTVEREFSYPVILKMNSGSRGINVFKCTDRASAQRALSAIYDKHTQFYDYIALAQEYVSIAHEYRVIVSRNSIVLVYEKDISSATSIDSNISPLHQSNSKAVLIENKELQQTLEQFIAPILTKMDIGFVGLDIVIDTAGKMWLLELNSKPGFEYFVRDNGREKLVEMYEKILQSLV